MDSFSLLSLPKRPLLSEEEIGAAYRKLAGELHPDQPGGDETRFKELGEAAAILRDPASRLRSLIDQAPSSAIPPEAVDLFPQVANLIREANALLARHASATTPLVKAVLAGPLKKLATDLDALRAKLENWRAKLENDIVTLDSAWPSYDPTRVASLADSFSYANRWESQLRERKLALECL